MAVLRLVLLLFVVAPAAAKKTKRKGGVAGKCTAGDCTSGRGTFSFESGDVYEGEWRASGRPEGGGMRHGQWHAAIFSLCVHPICFSAFSLVPARIGTHAEKQRNSGGHGWQVATYLQCCSRYCLVHTTLLHFVAGQGTFTGVDGRQYVGGFKDDKRHGLGTYVGSSCWVALLSRTNQHHGSSVKARGLFVGVGLNDRGRSQNPPCSAATTCVAGWSRTRGLR